MKRSREVITSTIKVPGYAVIGFFSRFLFVAFLPIGIYMILKAVVQKIRGVEVAAEPEAQFTVDEALIGQRFFHKGHTWVQPTAEGTVMVGPDYFAQKIIGAIDRIDVPPIGRFLQPGKIAWRLRHGERVLDQISPIEGKIVAINPALQTDPAVVAPRSTTDDGWVLKIRPSHLKENLKNLIPRNRVEKWLELIKSQLVFRFPGIVGPAYQDGGELIDGVCDTMSDEDWEVLRTEFFL